MQIKIADLYDRFPFFSYSLFQKYKVDSEEQPFFKSKKDLYLMLEANYYMEYKSRKKLVKYFEMKDLAPFTVLDLSKYHLLENPIKSLLQDFIGLEDKKIELQFGSIYRYSSKLEIYENLENKINTIKNIEGLDKFDNWVILEMIINLKRYKQFLPFLIKDLENNLNQYFDIEFHDNDIIMSVYDGSKVETKRKFLLRKSNNTNNVIVFEYIKTREKKLAEPRWVKVFKEGKDIYMDHKFNYLIIDYDRNSVFFNFIKLNGDKLSKFLF